MRLMESFRIIGRNGAAGTVRGVMDGAEMLTIETGYRPGVIGRIATMHALYYTHAAGFGRPFEAQVAAGVSEFSGRLDRPGNQLFVAFSSAHGIIGSVAIDGEDLGDGRAHLRWFIVDDVVRGQGAGRRLLQEALSFCDRRGFRQTDLWTFAGLDAARHLYEAHGFMLAEERLGRQWGEEVTEQRFVRPRPGSPDAST